MHEPVEDRVAEGGIIDDRMPFFYRDLTEDHGRTHLVTLFDDDAFLSDMPTHRTPAALSNLVAT